MSEVGPSLLSCLQRASAAFARANTSREVLEVTLEGVRSGLGAAAGALNVFEGEHLTSGYPPEIEQPEIKQNYARIPFYLTAPSTDAVKLKQPIWLEGADEFARRYPQFEAEIRASGYEASASVPLLVGEATLGVLDLSFTERRLWETPDRDFLASLASMAAGALERARWREAAHRAEAEGTRLLRVVEEERALLETFLSTAPVGFAFLDRDLRFGRVNEALAQINGLTASAHLGHLIEEVVPDLAPKARPLFEAVLETGEPLVALELSGETARLPGETLHWLENVYPVRSPDGEMLGLGVVVVEITERKRNEEALRASEARFRWLAEATPQMVWVFDAHSRLVYVNPAYTEITGLSLEQAQTGAINIIHPDDLPTFLESSARAAASGSLFRVEVRLRHAEREGYRWFLHQAVPIRENGAITGWYGTSTDIQAQKEAETALRQVNEAQQRFIADASHELRAPLTSIQGNLELLIRHPDMKDADRAGALADARSEAQRMARLVHDLVTVARGETEHGRRELVRLERCLAGVWRVAHNLSERHQFVLGELVPASTEGDPDRIKQLALILLENAVKYTPEGGTVRLESRLVDQQYEFSVSDTGLGIAEADLKRVFDRFYRVDQSRTRGLDPGGTGLGLTIARQIVEQLGGQISVSSQVGHGTVFTVRLPLAVEVEA